MQTGRLIHLSPLNTATALPAQGPATTMEVTMKKLVLAALAVFTLAIAVPVSSGVAASVNEAARLGDANGHTNSAN